MSDLNGLEKVLGEMRDKDTLVFFMNSMMKLLDENNLITNEEFEILNQEGKKVLKVKDE
ncbi:hypothetical protein [Viridibacillus sp. FSL H8-0123]|uniref:hypothetical protein n=1 Tax=Viridibacillus sp. FSL H8-0123 TaxID=1928922 RepID=UPI0014395270|nr:hypothetical protein [Viridibacillus sp. FSL H8-0123]